MGEPLERLWSTLSGIQKEYIRGVVYKAIRALRSIQLIAIDCGQYNVLYDQLTRSVTLVDVELMQVCERDTLSPEAPEMYAIFGDASVPD